MNKETAQKAAKWWADQLRGFAKHDNGDDSETGVYGAMLMTILQGAEKAKQTPEQVDAFEVALADVLMKECPRWGFGTDYHPDHILEAAAEIAGLRLGMATLPIKTIMWIDDDKVTVKCGYGAPTEEI